MSRRITESKKDRNKFARMLEKRLAIYHDATDIKRIASIIGYSDSTLRKHVKKGHLFAMMQNHKYLVPKFSLIKFLDSR